MSAPLQFSLRALLISFAVISVLLAPIPMFGMAYAVTMIFCLGVMFVTWRISIKEGFPAAFGFSLLCLILGFFAVIASIPFFFYTVCNAVVCLLLLTRKPKPKTSLAILSSAILIPFAFVMFDGWQNLRSYDQSRRTYPLVSIEDRLEPLTGNSTEAHSNLTLAVDVSASLDELEDWSMPRFYGRNRALESLHNDSYRHFVAAQGFGPARMTHRFAPYRLEFEPSSVVEFPIPLDGLLATEPAKLHDSALYDFFDSDRLGYVRSVQQVAGFEGHAFAHLPRNTAPLNAASSWQLTQLQLVSLLRNETPVAYITDSLPEMEGIEKYPHRELNTFERNALPQLRSEHDIVLNDNGNVIQMLGAVRAAKNCLDCHVQHRRGDLLGAFSYRLAKVK